MEYLEGGTLGEAVSHFKLEERQMAYVTQQILIGLSYLHKKDWVHRDLKVSDCCRRR
jgi:serine/threonine protein kinase